MKNSLTLTSSTFALLVLACQPKTKTKLVEVPQKEKIYNFTKESYGEPVLVPVYDAACNSQRGLGLSNGIIEDAFMGIENLSVKTFIGEEVIDADTEKYINRQTYETEVIDPGRPVILCRDASIIPINTQEGAAISMKGDVDQAFALYEAVKEPGTLSLPHLERVTLNAAQIEKQVTRIVDKGDEAKEYSSYMTDNAVFMRGERPTLISFPQSEESKQAKLLGGIPLWNVDGVFQHEFGHFIFDSLMNEGYTPFASYRKYAARNPDLHLFHTKANSLRRMMETPALKAGFQDFIRSQDFFVGSLNEGFADLWAYYTLQQPADMFNISCFAQNRNVAAEAFYNGISKSWDETLWKKTFHTEIETDLAVTAEDPVEECSQPIFSDIHIIGAAMAHTADAVFSAAAQTHSVVDTSPLKAEMSLAWLQSIKASEEFQDLGGKASLSRILNTAVGTGISYLKGADRKAFCAVVSSKFPVLVKRWKDAKTDNEDVSGVVSFCSL